MPKRSAPSLDEGWSPWKVPRMLPCLRVAACILLIASAGCGASQAPAAPSSTTVTDVAPVMAAPAETNPPTTTAQEAPEGMRALPIGNAARDFAAYLNRMHARIHPVFADEGLAKLDALPPDDPSNHPRLVVRIEVVVDGRTGDLVKTAIAKTSGNTKFDELAVDSIRRAAPFGSAPDNITSADGRVYVHWVLHRDPVHACSTYHSRPFLFGFHSGPFQPDR